MPTKDGNRLKAPVHDKFFYDAVLSDDQAVALLLKSLLPARIVERIDWAAGPERPADREGGRFAHSRLLAPLPDEGGAAGQLHHRAQERR